MAKLIFKVNYFKPNHPNSRGGYARYIATRDGVEKDDSHKLTLKATDKQKRNHKRSPPSESGREEKTVFFEAIVFREAQGECHSSHPAFQKSLRYLSG